MLDFKEQLMAIKTEMDKKELKSDKIIETKEIVHSNINNHKTMYNTENKKIIVRRAEVYWSDLQGSQGSEQGGERPVLIIQNDVGNTYSPTTIVAVITSQLTKAKLPVHVELQKEINNMPQDSVILFEQIRTLDKRRLKDKICELDELMMKKIDKAIGTSLGIKVAEPEQEKTSKTEKAPLEKLHEKLRNKIEEMLDDIYTYEKALCKTRNESLRNNLIEQREAFLWLLQNFCENNKLNYRDYYKKYNPERETVAM